MKTIYAAVIIHKTTNKVWNNEIFEHIQAATDAADARIPSKSRKNYRIVNVDALLNLLDSYQTTNIGVGDDLDESFED